MLSRLLKTLGNGLTVMRLNSQMFLVGVLVFVFPLIFIWITQSFLDTAVNNVGTAEKERVGVIHSSLLEALRFDVANGSSLTNNLLAQYPKENTDITKLRVVKEDGSDLKIIYSSREEQVGTYEASADTFRQFASLAKDNALIVPLETEGSRIWQVFRSVEIDNEEYVIFSEHNFKTFDDVMLKRRQESYFALTAIFLFLMALAYWLNKQIAWEKEAEKLKQNLQEQGVFSNMIAHEFRSPLTAIKGYTSFLAESKNLSPEEVRFAGNIKMSTERLILLVNDFLEVARLQSGKLKLEYKAINLKTLLERVVEDLAPLASKNNLVLSLDKIPNNLVIESDEARLIQVLINIVTNSIKYTKQGKVTLSYELNRKGISIIVKDTGMGISAEDQKKLFTPFARFGDVDKSGETGTGLGMWISNQLVTLLGGTLGAESIKGVGTHVIITLDYKEKI